MGLAGTVRSIIGTEADGSVAAPSQHEIPLEYLHRRVAPARRRHAGLADDCPACFGDIQMNRIACLQAAYLTGEMIGIRPVELRHRARPAIEDDIAAKAASDLECRQIVGCTSPVPETEASSLSTPSLAVIVPSLTIVPEGQSADAWPALTQAVAGQSPFASMVIWSALTGGAVSNVSGSVESCLNSPAKT